MHLVLVSRTGKVSDESNLTWNRLQSTTTINNNLKIEVYLCDVGVRKDVDSMIHHLSASSILRGTVIRGIIHTAGVLADGVLQTMNEDMLAQVQSLNFVR